MSAIDVECKQEDKDGEMPNTVLGEQLRRLRQASGYTQRELAACVRVDHTYLSKIENGHGLPPSVNLLHRIAKVLQVDEEALCALVGKPSVVAMRQRTVALREQVVKMQAERDAARAALGRAVKQLDLIWHTPDGAEPRYDCDQVAAIAAILDDPLCKQATADLARLQSIETASKAFIDAWLAEEDPVKITALIRELSTIFNNNSAKFE